jgi:S1-C subfamily serine protease
MLVSQFVEALAQRNTENPRDFTVREFLNLISDLSEAPKPDPQKYLRPAVDFLQRLVAAGLLFEVSPPTIWSRSADQRIYRSSVRFSVLEFFTGVGPYAFGLPYVAHAYGDVTVRLHVHKPGREETIGSGIVIARDKVITNAHVVRDADHVNVSWRDRLPVPVSNLSLHSDEKIDLAVVTVSGLDPLPIVILRAPLAVEPVVVLAYPHVPQVLDRPLLRFCGNVASDEPIATYAGHEQAIVSAVLDPGSSGGPVMGGDGCLVGLVIESLEGHYDVEGVRSSSIFHAIVPGDVLLRELPRVDKDLELNWSGTIPTMNPAVSS